MKQEFRLGERVSTVRFLEQGERAEEIIRREYPHSLIIWVADENTSRYLPAGEPHCLVLPAGEAFKTMETILRIVDFALQVGAGRDSLFVALGGGVVCDMTAFAASVYMRGAGVVLLPSTLLAMVDATLGGKSGVDYRGYKNIIGTFYPASLIIIEPTYLASLPQREIMGGLAEVVKHAMLSGEDALERIERLLPDIKAGNRDAFSSIIAESLTVKGAVIEQDPLERGIRAHLNLGHTFAHALESATGFNGWSHGEAVAWGLSRALHAGELLGETDPGYRRFIDELLDRFGYRRYAEADTSAILEAVGSDKKKRGGEVRFVLQRKAGDTFTRALPREIVEEAISGGCLNP
jgi:3-dehydroquinate synthase